MLMYHVAQKTTDLLKAFRQDVHKNPHYNFDIFLCDSSIFNPFKNIERSTVYMWQESAKCQLKINLWATRSPNTEAIHSFPTPLDNTTRPQDQGGQRKLLA